MDRFCVILYAIDVSLSFQALSDGLGLNAIKFFFFEFQHILVFLKLSSYNFMVIVPSAVVVTKFEQLQCKLKQVAQCWAFLNNIALIITVCTCFGQ